MNNVEESLRRWFYEKNMELQEPKDQELKNHKKSWRIWITYGQLF